jgi:hypothetical protein
MLAAHYAEPPEKRGFGNFAPNLPQTGAADHFFEITQNLF